ncbi:MAG TPA: hypothetical protein VKB50_28430 [Vicinamibacterales bacterium]|nr:hypothetical protein [Vicinamibacterales bacterium]
MNIDLAQIAVAAAATAGYACTSVVVRQAYTRRRRRQTRRDSLFVTQLMHAVQNGTIRALPDAIAFYRACTPAPSNDEIVHRLEFLIARAWARLLKRTRRDGAVNGSPGHDAVAVLRRLRDESSEAVTSALMSNARVSAEHREHIRLEMERAYETVREAPVDVVVLARRRESQRQTAAMLRRGLLGVGCIAFVQVALVVWQLLR